MATTKKEKINLLFGGVGFITMICSLVYLGEDFILINAVLVSYSICMVLCIDDLKLKAYEKRYRFSLIRFVFNGQKLFEHFIIKKINEKLTPAIARMCFSVFFAYLFLAINNGAEKIHYLILAVIVCELVMWPARKID